MKRLTIFSLTCLFSVGAVLAQQGVTQCGVPTGQPKFPLLTYQELPDPTAPSDKEWVAVTSTQVSWGTTDVRYAKHQLPQLKKQQTVSLKGWRGERVNAQAVVWTGVELKDLNFSFGDFKDKKGNVLPKDAFTGGFVRYVMTDELNKDGRGACGHRKSIDYDSLLVADPIDTNLKTMALPARTVQPVWVQCWIPQSATPGTYQGELLINDGSRLLQRLNLEITVSSRELPQPSEWAYHLDLWQSPYAVARYYQVPLWSQEHFDAMRPLMKMLADAGQKIITATLTHKPWNGQTEDYFDTMVTWIKRADGTWAFDYTIFDRWVEFMMSVGIDKQINCYSMVPWELSFQYYDQATNSLQFVKTAPGEAAYEEIRETVQIHDLEVQPTTVAPTETKVVETVADNKQESYVAPAGLADLMASNQNVIGWLTIGNTKIDYPVCQNKSDNEYFLHRDINGQKNTAGSIYLDSIQDINAKGLHVVYGHHMKNGTMFKDVSRFTSAKYMAEHQDITLWTGKREIKLKPIACYAGPADGSYRTNFQTTDELHKFIKTKCGKDIISDNVFVFITCSYGGNDERTYLICEEEG